MKFSSHQAKSTTSGLVSVVLPVYNASQFLEQSLNSIQKQIYTNWELIAVDDKSSDDSLTILKKFATKEKRIRIIAQKRHLGVSATANKAIAQAKGQYIARMDADDIALPTRLSKQVKFLNKHPEVIAVGGQCQVIDQHNKLVGQKNFPTTPNQVKAMAFYFYPVQQPALMVNTSKLPKNFRWYNPDLPSAEEHELLFKFFQYGQVANLKDTVLRYRVHADNLSLRNPKEDFFTILRTRLDAVKKYGYRPTFKALIICALQAIVITFMPSKMVYPLYTRLRGLKSLSLKSLVNTPRFSHEK